MPTELDYVFCKYGALFVIFLSILSFVPYLTRAFIGGQWVAFSPPNVPSNSICSPSGGNYSIFSTSTLVSNDGWAVGGCRANLSGVAFQWTGTTWITTLPPNTLALKGVARVSSTDAWAVGNSTGSLSTSTPTIIHWDGTGWTVSPSIPTNGKYSLNAVSMFSSTRGIAVGENGTIFRFSAPTWTKTSATPGTDNLTSVVALPNGKAVAVGYGGVVLRFDGTSWTSFVPGPVVNLNGVSFVNSTLGWAVGNSGTILKTTDGGAIWSIDSSGTVTNLRSIFAIDAFDVWAVGDLLADNQHAVILHWDGNGWSLFPASSEGVTKGKLWTVSMLSGTDGFAAGDFGSVTPFLRFSGPIQVTSTSFLASLTTTSLFTSSTTFTGGFTSSTMSTTTTITQTSYSTAATSTSTSTFTNTSVTVTPTSTASITATGTVAVATGTTTTTRTVTNTMLQTSSTTLTTTTSTTVTGLAVNGLLSVLGGLLFVPEIFRSVRNLGDPKKLKRLLLACVSVGLVIASVALAFTPVSSQIGGIPLTAISGSTTTKFISTSISTVIVTSTITSTTITSSTSSTLTFSSTTTSSSTVTSPTTFTTLSVTTTMVTSTSPGVSTSTIATSYTTLTTPGTTSTTTTSRTLTNVLTGTQTLTKTSTSQLVLPIGIPGFPWESVLIGLGAGVFALAVLRRRGKRNLDS